MDVKYTDNGFYFCLRVSAIVFNKDLSKVLLFNVEGRQFYLLPGGKIHQLEESLDGIKREISEELGWENIDYSFFGISEEYVTDKGCDNHQINLIYKGIYKDDIKEEQFKGLEGDWANFRWVDVKDIDNYNIFPEFTKRVIKEPNKMFHTIDNLIKKNSTE